MWVREVWVGGVGEIGMGGRGGEDVGGEGEEGVVLSVVSMGGGAGGGVGEGAFVGWGVRLGDLLRLRLRVE